MMIFRLFHILMISIFLFSGAPADAQDRGQVMLVLDGSGSMWGQVGGEHKIVIARDTMEQVISEWDPNQPMGLITYGHRRTGDCSDIELLQSVGPVDRDTLIKTVRGINPLGKTPLADSILFAGANMNLVQGRTSIVLVTDGLETCDENPCLAAQALENLGADFTAHVIGFDVSTEEFEELSCIAETTGGKLLRANSATELLTALLEVTQATAQPAVVDLPPAQEVATAPPESPATQILRAKMCEDCSAIEPLELNWSFVDGYRGLGVLRADEALPTGLHRAEVRFRSSALVRTVDVRIEEDGTQRSFPNLNGGSIQVAAYATADKSAPLEQAYFEFFPMRGETVEDSAISAQAIPRADTWLPAGKYMVTVANEGLSGKTILDLEAGETVQYDFDLRSGTLAPFVSLSEGTPRIGNGASFRIYETEEAAEASGGQGGFFVLGGSKLNLPPGDYFIRAQFSWPGSGIGAVVRTVPVQVVAGETTSPVVDLQAGSIEFTVESKTATYSGFLAEVWSVDETGQPEQRVNYSVNRTGRAAVTAGRYILRARNQGEAFDSDAFKIDPGGTFNFVFSIP